MYRSYTQNKQSECEYWPQSKKIAAFSFDLAATPLMKHPDDWREEKFAALVRGYVSSMQDGLYTPSCSACPMTEQCISSRIDLAKFKMTKSQQKKHDTFLDIASIELTTPDLSSDIYRLYQKYLGFRHTDTNTGMQNYSEAAFKTRFSAPLLMMTAREQSGDLIAVNFIDQHEKNFSTEYSIYDPEKAKLSPGISMTLIITNMMSERFPNGHMYMGSWSSGSPKLGYKSQFHGMEYYQGGQWVTRDKLHQASGLKPKPFA